MWAQDQHIYLFYECETQRNLEITLDSSILPRNDHKLREQLLTTAGVGTQPGRTIRMHAQGRHSVRLQRATFSAVSSLLEAQPEAGQLINDIIL